MNNAIINGKVIRPIDKILSLLLMIYANKKSK